MSDTAQFGLPLLAAAQAQKHVTVNEALVRLDALARLRVVSAGLAMPPLSANEGACYLVANTATGDWAGHAGQVAIWINGGWSFAAPWRGWTAFDEASGVTLLFDGAEWIADAAAASTGGAATLLRVVEFDHVVTAGTGSTTLAAIPGQSQVTGVSARVIVPITGTATGWSLGVAGATNRYGSGLGLAQDSYALGLSGTPVTYYADTPLVLTAEGGEFAAGAVRIALHLTAIRPPRAV
ncbi:MAG TPA: DUF2793 domain-containing protein [Paracoccaceae bacterium]|nr:DUF2793 domain-containing protein [Paracoccaceae bacterium]